MPLFIDESGNTGPVLGPPDRHFFLAGVWVPSAAVAEAIRADVQSVRRRLGLKEAFEFKYSWTGDQPERRRAFFEAALRHDFRFAVAFVDKRLDQRAGDSALIHWAVAVELAASFRAVWVEQYPFAAPRAPERIWVDDCQDDVFLGVVRDKFRELGSSLSPPQQFASRVQFTKSGPEEMIQLADMVCGAYREWVEDGAGEWYEMIRDRDVNRRTRA